MKCKYSMYCTVHRAVIMSWCHTYTGLREQCICIHAVYVWIMAKDAYAVVLSQLIISNHDIQSPNLNHTYLAYIYLGLSFDCNKYLGSGAYNPLPPTPSNSSSSPPRPSSPHYSKTPASASSTLNSTPPRPKTQPK